MQDVIEKVQVCTSHPPTKGGRMFNLHVPEHAIEVAEDAIQGAVVIVVTALSLVTCGVLIYSWFVA